MERVRIGPGVDLADTRADLRRRVDLLDLGVDEHAGDDARVGEPLHRVGELGLLPGDVEAAFGGDLVPALGHEHRHLRLQAAGDAGHLVGRRHLEVELDVRELAQPAHVVVVDVPAILAQVHGDAVGTAEVRFDGGPHGVRLERPPRLAQRGHVVDVDAELDHGSFTSDPVPASTARSVTMRRLSMRRDSR